ncbi:hypothetical protein [Phaffia rhodozyma]|uniref:Uncharacterized protein n=1 Tax=Phaffia rhodozyma TaxID=264483 RepID=A0A0F7SS64_PHARH|nr:hypothetical protein [Phaffia rhodozyma]
MYPELPPPSYHPICPSCLPSVSLPPISPSPPPPLTLSLSYTHVPPTRPPICITPPLPPLPSPPLPPLPALPPPPPTPPFIRGRTHHANTWPSQQQSLPSITHRPQTRALPIIPSGPLVPSVSDPVPVSLSRPTAESPSASHPIHDSLSIQPDRPRPFDQTADNEDNENNSDIARALKHSLTLSWKVSPPVRKFEDLQASFLTKDGKKSQVSPLAEEYKRLQFQPDQAQRPTASPRQSTKHPAIAPLSSSLHHRRHRPPPLPIRPGLPPSHSGPSRLETQQTPVSQAHAPLSLTPAKDTPPVRPVGPPIQSTGALARTPTLGWARTIISRSLRSDKARVETPGLTSSPPTTEDDRSLDLDGPSERVLRMKPARPILEIDADVIDNDSTRLFPGRLVEGVDAIENSQDEELGRLIYGKTTTSPPTLSPLHAFPQIPVIPIPPVQTGALYIIARTYADLVEELFSIGYVALEGSTDWAFALQIVSIQCGGGGSNDDDDGGKGGLEETEIEDEPDSAIVLWIQDKAKPGERKTRPIPTDQSLTFASPKTRQRKRLIIPRRSRIDQPSSSPLTSSPSFMSPSPSSSSAVSPSLPSPLPLSTSSISSPLLPIPSRSIESSARLVFQLPGFLPSDRSSVKSTLIPLPSSQAEIEDLTGLVDHLIGLVEPWGEFNQSSSGTRPARIPPWRLWTEGEHARFLSMITQSRRRPCLPSGLLPPISTSRTPEAKAEAGRMEAQLGDQGDSNKRQRIKTWLGRTRLGSVVGWDGAGAGEGQVVQSTDVLHPAGFITPFTFDRSLSEP